MPTTSQHSLESFIGLTLLALMVLALIAAQVHSSDEARRHAALSAPAADVVLIEALPVEDDTDHGPGIRRFRVIPQMIDFGGDSGRRDAPVRTPGH